MLLEPHSDESEAEIPEAELTKVYERFRRLRRLPLRPLRADVELDDERGMARETTRKLELLRLWLHAELMFGGRFVWVPSLTRVVSAQPFANCHRDTKRAVGGPILGQC